MKKEDKKMNSVAVKTAVLKQALRTFPSETKLKLLVENELTAPTLLTEYDPSCDYRNDPSLFDLQAPVEKDTEVPLTDENKDLLSFLQDNFPLPEVQRTKISSFLYGNEKLDDAQMSSVSEFHNRMSFLNKATNPFLEVKIHNKWYPILASCQRFQAVGGWMIDFRLRGMIGHVEFDRRSYLGNWDFEDNNGLPAKKTVNEVLKRLNVRIASPDAVEQTKVAVMRTVEFMENSGKVFDAVGSALVYDEYWGWTETQLGWKDAHTTVIVEDKLENEYAECRVEGWQLPFVRVFSLKHKRYMYIDVDELQDHKYDRTGKSKIILPAKMFKALESIFNVKSDDIFGDLFNGRHGGIVVLANGPSGVGKTLTAEVFAEHQERPLYTMEMGEIGTSLSDVEHNLGRIFARAKKWNAVLLFDEADIFLSERVASDLERSAIVGVFLRLLDYYEGTFFLTTNRGEGIDKAFKSRVTLYLDYPALSAKTRRSIWSNMLASAGMSVKVDKTSWAQIAKANLNGRQIRNQVRLLKLMYPNNKIKTSDIVDSLEFAAR